MLQAKRLYLAILILFISAGCKENYQPPVIQKGVTALVVDGFINNSADTTFIRLSHTNKLGAGVSNASILGAQMTIEDASGNTLYNFQQLNDSGIYVVPGMNLDVNSKYRVRILTGSNQYLSDEIPVVKTPPVDSITVEHTAAGAAICANTHDPLNNTHYYRWEYTETFQYHAPYFSGLIWRADFPTVLWDRTPAEYIYTCWKTQNNTQLLTFSTTQLSEDIVYHNTVRFVDQDGLELSVKYLIALRQFALTKESFEYLENLKKITEQTGSIFDAQPSQLTGNIHSLNNKDDIVLGYLTASTEETKQLYITNDEVQPWEYKPGCVVLEIKPEMVKSAFLNDQLVPLSVDGSPLMPKGYFVSSLPCADCRVFGGSTTKPFFFQ